MNAPLTHLVIPVHNGGQHLVECLESVVALDYPNWRATVVNNGSTDGTAAIADRYAQKDVRIKAQHFTECVAQSESYNRAITLAAKEAVYIKILEADNWITSDSIGRAVELAEREARVGIVGSYWLRGARVDGWGLDPTLHCLPGKEALRYYFRNRIYLFGTPTTLLFRAQALREESVWFRPGLYYDDFELCIRIQRQWDFGFVHQVLAFVRDDNGGLFSEVRAMDYEPAMRHMLMHEHGQEWFEGAELKALQQRAEQDYLRRLARAWLLRSGKQYWDLHQSLYRSNGMDWRKSKVLAWAVRLMVERTFAPLVFGFEQLRRSQS